VLTLWAPQAESLWDESLPLEVKELPADLAELDRVLAYPELLMVLVERWRREVVETQRAVLTDGRPTIAMETYVRLMVLKARYRWGYRTLVAEVSDSIHLRRFCRISLGERVPDESTVRKLTRRIGAETVNELTRSLIETAVREKRFRPRAVRVDSTVVEADVRYPTDADLASHGVKVLAREARKLAELVKEKKARVRDRSRSMGRKLRAVSRTIRRRTGEAKAEVLALTEQTGELLQRSVKEARTLAAVAKRRAVGRGAAVKRRAAERLEELADRCEKVASQIRQRIAGDPIKEARVARRSRRAADPQGEARQAQRVRVRQPDLRGDRAHPPRRSRSDRARLDPAREPGRGHAAPGHDQRTDPRDPTQGNRAGRRLQSRPDPPDARRSRPRTRAGVHRRPPATRQPPHPTTVAALPNRHRKMSCPGRRLRLR
jgi:IS5 family transposase